MSISNLDIEFEIMKNLVSIYLYRISESYLMIDTDIFFKKLIQILTKVQLREKKNTAIYFLFIATISTKCKAKKQNNFNYYLSKKKSY